MKKHNDCMLFFKTSRMRSEGGEVCSLQTRWGVSSRRREKERVFKLLDDISTKTDGHYLLGYS